MNEIRLHKWICDAREQFRSDMCKLGRNQSVHIFRWRTSYAGGQLAIISVMTDDCFDRILDGVEYV